MSASETNSDKFDFRHMAPRWVLNVDTDISNHVEATQMKRLLAASMGVLMVAGTAMAATDLMSRVTSDSVTVTDWYKQPVYDSNNNKLVDVKDVLVDRSGKISAMILGVGGVLGAGEKDVAVPFEAVKKTAKNNEAYLTLDVTKDSLKSRQASNTIEQDKLDSGHLR